MKRARAVIGANYGDEGKGLVTDYLCAKEGAGIVVRFNGGANAGHTVVTPDGRRHVFSHFGSGSFAGVPTYLSEYFIINPVCFFREGAELHKVEKHIPKVYAHPNCKVTTFADMIINQRREAARGADRHGSCGVGFAETIDRCTLPGLDLTMADLWNGKNLEPMLAELCGNYAKWRTGARIDEPKMVENFIRECELIANLVDPLGIASVKDLDPVFEGAQGLLLDQDNKAGFPHLTKSSTGMKNVRALCAQAGIDTVETYFVTRSYLTRHGAGPLAGHDPNLLYVDDTNLSNDWQGDLRFSPLSGTDVVKLCERVEAEGGGHLVVTHCDQKTPDDQLNGASLFCFGPTRNDVESSLAKAASHGGFADRILAEAKAKSHFEAAEAARAIAKAPLFYWNGIKDTKGEKLQPCFYSKSDLSSAPAGTISIYARNYASFSKLVRECFEVKNDTDVMTDYFDNDRIRVIPSHPLYAAVKAAAEAADAHADRRAEKRAAQRRSAA